jgi:hypothetical protein
VCSLLALDAAAECPAAEEGAHTIESDVIRVATLNIAHGRKDGRLTVLMQVIRALTSHDEPALLCRWKTTRANSVAALVTIAARGSH